MAHSDISKNLSRLMSNNKLSQSALSRATGVPQPTINRILSQVTREPRRDSVLRIANFFSVTPESLYSGKSSSGVIIEKSVDDIYKSIAMLDTNQRADLMLRVNANLVCGLAIEEASKSSKYITVQNS